jgi:hypothetical protein
MVRWLLPNTKACMWNSLLRIIIAIFFFIVAGSTVGLFIKGMFLIGTLIVFIVVTWLWLLASDERRMLKKIIPLYLVNKR